jgi:hypothetical protein
VQSGLLTLRSVHALIRQPWYAAITLVQPVIWLLLFGQLFRSVVHIPGFASSQDGSGSYLEFISPGRDRGDRAVLSRLGRHDLHRGHEPRGDGSAACLAGVARRHDRHALAYRVITT